MNKELIDILNREYSGIQYGQITINKHGTAKYDEIKISKRIRVTGHEHVSDIIKMNLPLSGKTVITEYHRKDQKVDIIIEENLKIDKK